MYDEDVRNMKKICSLLHELRLSGDFHYTVDLRELGDLIDTAESVYHRMKAN